MLPDVLCKLLRDNTVIAKKYKNITESLGDHTNSLIKVSKVIYSLFNEKHPINMDTLTSAIHWHDVGKCEKSWLDNKNSSGRRLDPANTLSARHELLSFLVAYNYYKDSNLSNYEKCLILIPILLHHNKYISIKSDFSDPNFIKSTLLKDNTRKIEWMYDLDKVKLFKESVLIKENKNKNIVGKIRKVIKEISSGISREQSYDIQYHCMLLCAIDQLASSGVNVDDIKSMFDIKYCAPKKSFSLREYQTYAIDTFNDKVGVFIMDLRPGAGKTTITESICEKMNKCPIHGTPKNIIADDLASKFLDSRIFDMSDNIDEIRKKFHWFTKKKTALYTTPDNIFLMSQGYKRHFMFLRSLYNGIIILDEYHDCYLNDLRGFNLFEMIKKFNHFNIPVVLMSGTTPTNFVSEIVNEIKETGKDCHFISDRNGKLSHELNGRVINGKDIIIENTTRGKIVFHEGTPDDTLVSGFPWWDCKDFTVGYFNDVMTLVNSYVKEKESTAICFSSKKTIFHFIHLLHKTTEYRLWKDFAVVCSPKMVFSDSVQHINHAISELKKDNIGKNRKYKFILCTSYTEMGVDFSVKNLIIEACFLHNLDQQLGRLNRWNEFGEDATCTIFPAFTRHGIKDTNYRRIRYGSDSNYNNIVEFYKKKCPIKLDKNWYSQKEMNLHYLWCINTMPITTWEFEKTCGVYRTDDETNAIGVNGMYRDINSVPFKPNGSNIEFQVPIYRINKNKDDLTITPHPDLFI